jgi:hypothetical protein
MRGCRRAFLPCLAEDATAFVIARRGERPGGRSGCPAGAGRRAGIRASAAGCERATGDAGSSITLLLAQFLVQLLEVHQHGSGLSASRRPAAVKPVQAKNA